MRVDADDGRVGIVDEQTQVSCKQRRPLLSILAIRDILADAHHANDVACRVATCGRIEEYLDAAAVLGVQWELEVGRLSALEGLLQHLLHGLLELGRDEFLHEVLAHHLLLSVAGDLDGLAVPLVDEAIFIDAEDGRVRRVDEHAEIVRNASKLHLRFGDLGDILADADHADDLARRIEPRRCVEQDFHTVAIFLEEWKGEVVCRLAAQRIVEHGLDRRAELLADELLDKLLPHHILLGVPCDVFGLTVPLVDAPVRVDAKDGRVRCLNEEPQVVGDLAQLLLRLGEARDILPDAEHADDRRVFVATRCRVEKHLDTLAVLGEEWEDEVVGAMARERLLEHLLHGLLKLGRDELEHEVLAHHLLLGEGGDLGSLPVPLVDEAFGVHAEDGRIRRVNEQAQVVGHTQELRLRPLARGNVLSDAHDASHRPGGVAPCRERQQ